jgi:hypothetical protein
MAHYHQEKGGSLEIENKFATNKQTNKQKREPQSLSTTTTTTQLNLHKSCEILLGVETIACKEEYTNLIRLGNKPADAYQHLVLGHNHKLKGKNKHTNTKKISPELARGLNDKP